MYMLLRFWSHITFKLPTSQFCTAPYPPQPLQLQRTSNLISTASTELYRGPETRIVIQSLAPNPNLIEPLRPPLQNIPTLLFSLFFTSRSTIHKILYLNFSTQNSSNKKNPVSDI